MPIFRDRLPKGGEKLVFADDPKKAKGGHNLPPPNSPNSVDSMGKRFDDDSERLYNPQYYVIFYYHTEGDHPRVNNLEILPLADIIDQKDNEKYNLYELRTGKLVMSAKTEADLAGFDIFGDTQVSKASKKTQKFAEDFSRLYTDVASGKIKQPGCVISLRGFTAEDFYEIIGNEYSISDPEYEAAKEYMIDSLNKEDISASALKTFCERGNTECKSSVEKFLNRQANKKQKLNQDQEPSR